MGNLTDTILELTRKGYEISFRGFLGEFSVTIIFIDANSKRQMYRQVILLSDLMLRGDEAAIVDALRFGVYKVEKERVGE